jgi:hypothetical protein
MAVANDPVAPDSSISEPSSPQQEYMGDLQEIENGPPPRLMITKMVRVTHGIVLGISRVPLLSFHKYSFNPSHSLFSLGIGKFQELCWSPRDWALSQVFFFHCGTEWFWKIQRH